MKHFTAVDKQL